MARIYLRTPVRNVAVVEKIVTVHYFDYRKDYRSRGESHDFWEINYVDRGKVIISCDGVEHELTKGEMILLPANKHHSLRADGEKPSSVFIISFEMVSEFFDHQGCCVLKLHDHISEKLNDLVQECRQTYSLPMPNLQTMCLSAKEDALPGSEQMVRIRLEILLIELIRFIIEQQSGLVTRLMSEKSIQDDDIAAKIMDILVNNLYNRLTLEDIAEQLGYSKTHIVNIFRRVYSTSIMAYYTQLRIDEAKRLLHDGDATIAIISEKMGFSTPQYFSKCFAHHVGMSPREFQSSIKNTWSTVKRNKI